MNRQLFATHLGFYTWEQLVDASERVSLDHNRAWFVAPTPTWYKWILWNTEYDVYFNHGTRDEALSTLKHLYEQMNVQHFEWNDSSDFESLESRLNGVPDHAMSWLNNGDSLDL